ncbi:hypothetical protein Lal_00043093 [Lupinus albus]|nr:hypothetical protein Lal_00043093 [Lupinus albus]
MLMGKKGVDETEHGTIMALNVAESLNEKGANVGVDGKGMIEANMGAVENEDLAFEFGNAGRNEFEHGSSTP